MNEADCRRTFNLLDKYGWINIAGEIRYVCRNVWLDTIAMPHRRRQCAKQGHVWYSPISESALVCERCYASSRRGS